MSVKRNLYDLKIDHVSTLYHKRNLFIPCGKTLYCCSTANSRISRCVAGSKCCLLVNDRSRTRCFRRWWRKWTGEWGRKCRAWVAIKTTVTNADSRDIKTTLADNTIVTAQSWRRKRKQRGRGCVLQRRTRSDKIKIKSCVKDIRV